MIARIIVNGAALLAAALVVPGITIRWGDSTLEAALTVGVLALIFGLINAYLRPILRIVSLPLNLLTLGAFSFVLNAALLLLLAWVAWTILDERLLRLGDFPPTLDGNALLAAVLGSIVISAISTLMSLLTPDA